MAYRKQLLAWANRHGLKPFDASGLHMGVRRSDIPLVAVDSKRLQKTLWFDYKVQSQYYDVSIGFLCHASRELWLRLFETVWAVEHQRLIAVLRNPLPCGLLFSVGVGTDWGFDTFAGTDDPEPLDAQLAKLEQLALEPFFFGLDHEDQYLDVLLSHEHPFQWWKTNALIRACECFAVATILNKPLEPVAIRVAEFEKLFRSDLRKPYENKAGVAELLQEAKRLSRIVVAK
jgi:hypothetical protein